MKVLRARKNASQQIMMTHWDGCGQSGARHYECLLADFKKLQSANEENEETLKRLRKLIPGCDCDNPSQCWEECGMLGHSEKHIKVVKED